MPVIHSKDIKKAAAGARGVNVSLSCQAGSNQFSGGLQINIGAVIKNTLSIAHFLWVMLKTTAGGLITIISCLKSGILKAAESVAGKVSQKTIEVLEAVCVFLSSRISRGSMTYITAFEKHVSPILRKLSWWAGFVLTVGVTAYVIHSIYLEIVNKCVEGKLGFSTAKEELKNINIEPILASSFATFQASLNNENDVGISGITDQHASGGTSRRRHSF